MNLTPMRFGDKQWYLVWSNQGIHGLDTSLAWLEKRFAFVEQWEVVSDSPYIEMIQRYWEGNLEEHAIPIQLLCGTTFQQQVWQELLTIPRGEVRSYQEIATQLGKPKAVRAVAHAIGQNPILMFIPCHRVIKHNGELGGYRGDEDLKAKLLQLEGFIINENAK